ncbi:hypothetical protein SAMN04489726_7166 [Allokutzneria albata]|uniref:Uncharacterized protein n=1 Tax=Allokutzneria albata TaxID=211114 RepID=A0A1H0CDT2_ALLAB|nr:hypothetical protein SAMN04489726_7166 [Allokutzneria albata]
MYATDHVGTCSKCDGEVVRYNGRLICTQCGAQY